MKKILIIGGEGFIGKSITDYFLKCGYEIGIYDVAVSNRKDVVSYQGDVINDKNIDDIIKAYDTIIYLISAIMPQKSMDEPTSSYLTDIPLLIKVLEAARRTGMQQVIYSSSGGTIYGDSDKANLEEECGKPDCHYGICKQTCEDILLLYNKLYGMKNIILRISNPYGLYQNGKNGVGVITVMTLNALKEKQINVWGDGENERDFVAIEEVENAFEKAVSWKFDERYIPIFNIGSGKATKINDIVRIICQEIPGIRVNYLPQRDFDVRCNYLDITKAEKILGYRVPEDVEASIRKYVRRLLNDEK